MAPLYAALLLTIAFDPGFSHILGDENSKILEWPIEYNIRGEKTDLVTGIIKPFEIWSSGISNVTRVDYYGGTVKEYYFIENEESHGIKYMIVPITSEDLKNDIICIKEPYKRTTLQVLEKSENFVYSGKTIYNDQEVQIWKLQEIVEDNYIVKKKEVTFYVHVDENQLHIPVFRENITYNLWTGGIERHSVTRYFGFKEVDPADLDINLVEECNDSIVDGPVQSELKRLHHFLDTDSSFYSFKMHHNKKYNADDHDRRISIFHEKLRRVIEHNKKNLGYKLTINKYSDLSDDEVAHLFGTGPSDPEAMGSLAFPYTEEETEQMAQDLPENYDMRIEGIISSVKNQAFCGSCWAFATTAAVEGALARSNGVRDLDLSEQSLVDCSWGFGLMGCDGGFLDNAFRYVLKYGMPTELDYGSYLEADGYCNMDNVTDIYRIKGYAKVPALSVDALKLALYNHGPVTVGINASPVKDYGSGIFYDPECNDGRTNHAVTVVGYGVMDGNTYWIVKNSWGEDWGEDGYILMSANNNNCHLLENAYFPII